MSLLPIPAFCQQAVPATTSSPDPEPKHVLWIIPNFRISPSLAEYKPLNPRDKFRIATLDLFDRGTVALGVLFATEAQLMNSNPSFGQGVRGYARYFGTAYADYVIGDYMTEAVFPTILHQDPRYFRRGTGSGWSRLGYAAGQVFWTHNDSGRGSSISRRSQVTRLPSQFQWLTIPRIAMWPMPYPNLAVSLVSTWRRNSSRSCGRIGAKLFTQTHIRKTLTPGCWSTPD